MRYSHNWVNYVYFDTFFIEAKFPTIQFTDRVVISPTPEFQNINSLVLNGGLVQSQAQDCMLITYIIYL